MGRIKFNLAQGVDPNEAGRFGYIEDIKNPFKVWIFPNFLPENVFKQLSNDVTKKIPLQRRYSDMFNFFQSRDIAEFPQQNSELINDFIETMRTDVKAELQKVSEVELDDNSPFDVTVSRYDAYNYLLCHNDHNPDPSRPHRRALAYIYYLTSGVMKKTDGGALSLYSTDNLEQPIKIQQKIYPNPNTLVVFRASSISWHSVDECLSFFPTRLSINGWFNSTKLPVLPNESETMEPCPYIFYKPLALTHSDVLTASQIINPKYLNQKFLIEAKSRFQSDGMLKLVSFLNPQIYSSISQNLLELSKLRANQIHQGPCNKRNYLVLKIEKMSPLSIMVLRFFRSEKFLALLRHLTGVEFKASVDENLESVESDLGNKFLNNFIATETRSQQVDIEPPNELWPYASGTGKTSSDPVKSKNNRTDNRLTIVDNNEDLQYLSDVYKIIGVDEKTKNQDLRESCVSDDSLKRQAGDQPNGSNIKKAKTDHDHLVRLEFRNYEQGSYTILNDESYEMFECDPIDIMLPFNSDRYNNDNFGGCHSYLDRENCADDGSNKEIVRILPEPNSLNIVARKSNMRFFRYMTHHIPFKNKSTFQELNGVYYYKPDLLPGFKNTDKQEV